MSFEGIRLYLLRHGEVESHRGDVPITPAALEQSRHVGSHLADVEGGPFLVLSGETRRALQTAENLTEGLRDSGAVVDGPVVSHALRNPDMYLAGVRVNMVSSAEALAEQVPGMSAGDVDGLDFYPQFFVEPDRIGWWLRHEDPPGEGAAAIAERIEVFARSLADPHPSRRPVVVAVTHSPLLRAAGLHELGRDIGEPPWISGLRLEVDDTGAITTEIFAGDA
jgi:broad specificity phosphatase PhoE